MRISIHAPAWRHTPVALAALLALGVSNAQAQPAPTTLPVLRPGGTLLNATVAAPGGNALAITQTPSAANRGLIEWSSFSIGSQARVNITQPNAQSVLVNRVVGAAANGPSASEIYGSLTANGRVFLLNPAGVVFGPGAQVNTGSLLATSLDLATSMSDNNYAALMRGDDVALAGTALVQPGVQVLVADDPRRPQIQVGDGGTIVLLSADSVSQAGAIAAPGGRIHLSTGSAATVRPVGSSGYVEVVSLVTPEPLSGGVDLGFNSRTVASGGSIIVGSQAGEEKGTRADTITIAGVVSTDAATATTAAAGTVHIDAGTGGSVVLSEGANLSASSTAAGSTGGTVTVLGRDITLQRGDVQNPQILAEGTAGGGRIVVGDDATRSVLIDERTTLSADATRNGAGGSVSVRAMYNNPAVTSPVARIDFGVTEVYGTVRARGGVDGGNGGHVETSGLAVTTSLSDPASGLTKHGVIDASARAARASAGAWTLDPYDVTISNSAPVAVNGSFNPTGPGANVNASDLSAALDAGTSIVISTDAAGAGTAAGNITIAAGTTITRLTGTTPTSLTLRANNDIQINATILDANRAGPVNLNLYADIDGNGSGGINIIDSNLFTGGGNVTLSGGLNPATGFAQGTAQAPGISLQRTDIDTRGVVVRTDGQVVMRGQAANGSTAPGITLQGNILAGAVTVDGLASTGTAVQLNGSNITSSGNVAVRGLAIGNSPTQPLVGIDANVGVFNVGTGSLTLAGRAENTATAGAGATTGLLINDLRISGAQASTGTITLAGQALGGITATGVGSASPTGSVLFINSNVLTAGSPPTGAKVVIGGSSSTPSSSLNISSAVGLNVASSAGVNIRPLGVGASGAVTEQSAVPITVKTITSNAGLGTFVIDSSLLRLPGTGNGGIAGGTSVVVGSSAHTGLITLDTAALASHATASLTLQNQGVGSSGIALGGGNTIGSLALMTSGNITQTGALTVLQGLALEGGPASNFALTNAANQIGRVAFDPPGTLNLLTTGALAIDAVTSQGYNAATGSFTPLAITTSLGGNTALLQAAGAVNVNQSIRMTGSGATRLDIVSPTSVTFASGALLTSASAAGQWRVWAPSVVNAPFAGPATNLYGCVFGDTTACSVSGIALPTAGNQLLHPTQPTLTVTANTASGYVDLALPALGFSTAGLANGDTAAGALAGALAATPTGPTTYAIGQGSLRSPLGYNLAFVPGTLTLQPGLTRHMLQSSFQAELSSDVYGRNLDQPFICTAASVIRGGLAEGAQGDPLAAEWGKVRNQPQLSGCLNVTDGGSCSAF